jgi:cation transport protein ChaC
MDEFWVFGYGSLMWNPGFDFVEKSEALIFGYRRALCVHSWVHRGTEASPGLVLGLDRVTKVYLERMLPIRLTGGRRVTAVAYVVDRSHRQYAGALGAVDAARIVNFAKGQSGPNDAYVFNTLEHLRQMGIRDQWLEDVSDEIVRMREAS